MSSSSAKAASTNARLGIRSVWGGVLGRSREGLGEWAMNAVYAVGFNAERRYGAHIPIGIDGHTLARRALIHPVGNASSMANTRARHQDSRPGRPRADRAARVEAEVVVDCWNRRVATGRHMLWSPTIRAALLAGTPWLDMFCPGCGTSPAIDLRTIAQAFRTQTGLCPYSNRSLFAGANSAGNSLARPKTGAAFLVTLADSWRFSPAALFRLSPTV
jgi:hypothetical protein